MNENVTLQSGLVKTEDGFAFRDLNKNGKLDIYEDSRQPIQSRVADLLGQMTLEEKAGTMFINGASVNDDGSIEEKPGARGFGHSAVKQVRERRMTVVAPPWAAGAAGDGSDGRSSVLGDPDFASRLWTLTFIV